MRFTLTFVAAALVGLAAASPVPADADLDTRQEGQTCVIGRGCPKGYVCIPNGDLSVLGKCRKLP